MKEISINTEFIKLNQFLKWSRVAKSGGEANHLISEGRIKVNDEVELRRGRKLYPGDIVQINEHEQFLITKEGSANIAAKGAKP